MTKKNYQAIARAIYATRDEYRTDVQGTFALDAVQSRITDVLAADNPRFDRQRFITACETGRTKGMPR